jgi:ADP-heptose:LPS heptosyltransferase
MKLLVIRLSAMGDVALSVPVIKAMSEQHKNVEIKLVTNKLYNVFFTKIENIQFINPDLKGKHKGIIGLFKLQKEIKKDFSPDAIIDIHNVLRSKILRFFFRLSGINSVKIIKGRKEKRKLTRKRNKNLIPLKQTTDRYAETFIKAGFPLVLSHSENNGFDNSNEEITKLIHDKTKKIGIAPFAKHPQKQYPLEKTEALIKKLSENNFHIFLFGGGKKEKITAKNLEKK